MSAHRRTETIAATLAAVLVTAGCGSHEPAVARPNHDWTVNTIVLTRDDGSRIAVTGPVAVTCGPANGDGPPALLVRVGRHTPRAPRAFWEIQVGLANLKEKHAFRFPQRNGVGDPIFFAFDASSGENELSSSAEGARGRVTFSKGDCRKGVDLRIRAHLGSEFFDQPGADVRGRFAAPPS